MAWRLPLALVITGLAASVGLVTTASASASGSSSCASKVTRDWYDNDRIDGTYPIACYREALSKLPTEVQTYTDAPDVINRALQLAIIAGRNDGGTGGKTGPAAAPATVSATEVPVPLIVLGVLALLLLAAGAAGAAARRLHERRVPATPDGSPPSERPRAS